MGHIFLQNIHSLPNAEALMPTDCVFFNAVRKIDPAFPRNTYALPDLPMLPQVAVERAAALGVMIPATGEKKSPPIGAGDPLVQVIVRHVTEPVPTEPGYPCMLERRYYYEREWCRSSLYGDLSRQVAEPGLTFAEALLPRHQLVVALAAALTCFVTQATYWGPYDWVCPSYLFPPWMNRHNRYVNNKRPLLPHHYTGSAMPLSTERWDRGRSSQYTGIRRTMLDVFPNFHPPFDYLEPFAYLEAPENLHYLIRGEKAYGLSMPPPGGLINKNSGGPRSDENTWRQAYWLGRMFELAAAIFAQLPDDVFSAEVPREAFIASALYFAVHGYGFFGCHEVFLPLIAPAVGRTARILGAHPEIAPLVWPRLTGEPGLLDPGRLREWSGMVAGLTEPRCSEELPPAALVDEEGHFRFTHTLTRRPPPEPPVLGPLDVAGDGLIRPGRRDPERN